MQADLALRSCESVDCRAGSEGNGVSSVREWTPREKQTKREREVSTSPKAASMFCPYLCKAKGTCRYEKVVGRKVVGRENAQRVRKHSGWKRLTRYKDRSRPVSNKTHREDSNGTARRDEGQEYSAHEKDTRRAFS